MKQNIAYFQIIYYFIKLIFQLKQSDYIIQIECSKNELQNYMELSNEFLIYPCLKNHVKYALAVRVI